MKQLISKLQHHITIVRSVSTGRVIKSFANDHSIVYFGSVDQHEDEHRLVHGITLSKDHRDRHYCVGSIDGRDVILLQRTDTIHYPSRPSRHYTWIIMQFDLLPGTKSFRHLLVDAHHHDATFYGTLAVKFSKLHKIDAAAFSGHEPNFINKYRVLSERDNPQLPYVLRPDVTAALSSHFKHLDFEIEDDRVLVYASNIVTTRHSLDHIAKAGLWLSQTLETIAQDPHFPEK